MRGLSIPTLPGAPGGNRNFWWSGVLVALLMTCSAPAQAVNKYARVTGNWNAAGTWSTNADCTTVAATTVPGNADDAFICPGVTVTSTANVAAGSAPNSVTVQATGILTVSTATFRTVVGGGGITVNGTMNMNQSVIVGGPTNLSGGTINFATAGAKTFQDLVTVSSGTWNNAANELLTFNGGLTVDGGTFTAGTGAHTFSVGATQNIGGTSAIVIPSITVTGVTLTNTGTLTTATALAGTGTFVNGTNATLNLGMATVAVTNFDASNTGNTVNYFALATQNIRVPVGGEYWNLTFSAASGLRNRDPVTASTYNILGNFAVGANTNWRGTQPATDPVVNITGNLVNDGTFTTGNNAYTLSGDFTNNSTFTHTAGGTLTLNGTAAQAIGGTSAATFLTLTITNTSAAVTANTNFNVSTTLNMNGVNTLFTPAAAVVTGGAGTLTGTGTVQVTRTAATADFGSQYTITNKTLTNLTVEYVGTAAQTMSAITYGHLKINNANGVTLAGNATAGGTLTLTSGNVITTSAFVLDTTATCATSVVRTSGHVVGNLRKAIPTGNSVCIFEIGSGADYTPVAASFSGVTTPGSIVASTTGAEHPNINTSVIDMNDDAARYWTLANSGVAGGTWGATFNFVATDLDAGATTADFIVQRYSPPTPAVGAWNATTLGTANPLNTSATGLTLSEFGDFAVGFDSSTVPNIGRFNAFETTTVLGVPPVDAVGQGSSIFTKVAGVAPPGGITVTMIAINNTRTAIQTGFNNTANVELWDASDNSGVSTNGCKDTWVKIKDLADATFVNGIATPYTFAEVDVYPHARLRIRRGVANRYGCSTDGFAIRPHQFINFTVTHNDWVTPGTMYSLDEISFGSDPNKRHKAGRPFSVRATAVNSDGATATKYTLKPDLIAHPDFFTPPTPCGGAACTATAGAAALGTNFVAGVLTDDNATYSEVGSVRMKLRGIEFSTIDSGDLPAQPSSVRDITSAEINVGRFVPNHFEVALTPPIFTTACGAFTYVGQSFSYGTAPVVSVTARRYDPAAIPPHPPTTLYAGNWWRITNASLNQLRTIEPVPQLSTLDTQPTRYSRFDALPGVTPTLDLSALPLTTADPVVAVTGAGVGTLTFDSSNISFKRTDPGAPFAPFNADISLAINLIDLDEIEYESPIGTKANPLRFGQATATNGISFTSGKGMRFGRLRLENGLSNVLLPVTLPMRAQYWTGTTFATNTLDSCTTLPPANVGYSAYAGKLQAGEVGAATVVPATLASGVGSIVVPKPSGGDSMYEGSVLVTGDLSAAGMSYLKGNWGGAGFTFDPSARAAFGVYGAKPRQFIFFRENY